MTMFDLDALAELDRGLNALSPVAVRAVATALPRTAPQVPAACPATAMREGRCPFFLGGAS